MPRLHLLAPDLIPLSGEGECVVVGDDAIFGMAQDGSKIQASLKGRC
jgi:hypothetical protein